MVRDDLLTAVHWDVNYLYICRARANRNEKLERNVGRSLTRFKTKIQNLTGDETVKWVSIVRVYSKPKSNLQRSRAYGKRRTPREDVKFKQQRRPALSVWFELLTDNWFTDISDMRRTRVINWDYFHTTHVTTGPQSIVFILGRHED